ncbi:penicillin-binding protein 2 [Pelolinea submarina]|uniref:Peptidoglycan glycosyltransferase n=1 Tax=Pelolinea submarina TaxID=913107 RepID=A0A347ZTK0_9CHLR|nr:penicillin-binding protein 2 [Pelolinea submarina]REG10794.1 peptidoglycan glycosyltransferase [Pelolinea submarina]BBB48631.1 penicillin-binding protein 2 [Pelolinea submarina]
MNNAKGNKPVIDKWRIRFIYILIAIVFGFYTLKLFTVQIINGNYYLEQSEDNRTNEINIQTERGIIMDRNGVVLARNVASYNVTITPADLPGDPTVNPLPGAIQEIYRELSPLIDIPVSNGVLNDDTVKLFTPCYTDFGIAEIVIIQDTNAPYTAVNVACDIDKETAMIISEKATDWPGVGIKIEPIREYPTGDMTSEIIGFLGPIPATQEEYYREEGFVTDRDKVGYAGVESTLNDILAGKNGKRVVEVDVAGKEIRDLEPPVDPIPGNNVKLTIDTRLQAATKAALIGEIQWWNRYFNTIRSSNGVAIAVNPKTGEVLAMVSYPTFENNRMAKYIPAYYYNQLLADPLTPLFNHAISAEHPPGSVFKLSTAIGVMNEGVVTPNQSLTCPGKITITEKYSPNDPGYEREYVCYDELGHGQVSYTRAIALSCDIYFYKVGGGYAGEVDEGLGIDRLAEYAKALSYGQATGIELPGEAEGLIPTSAWKRINMSENWSTGDTYIAAMGQGYVLSTALQVVESAAIIANDGVYMQPTLVREVLDSDGNVIQSFTPKVKWDITKDPLITVFDENGIATEEKKTVAPWVIDLTQEGMRKVVADTEGTAHNYLNNIIINGKEIPVAGKTGTAEYCDNVAQEKGLCIPGSWPTHSWFVGYAPYDDPEIAVVAFVYNGGEGASVAGPIARKVFEAYFELKAIDAGEPEVVEEIE